jgi:simple sugar transport system permease protein/D-xylose transport system permease protein
MTDTKPQIDPTASPLATDLQDERLQSREGLRGYVQSFVDRTRAGDLGVLPVIGGLVVIWTVFQILNPIFLSSRNLENLAMESVVVGIISLGIVGILLVGQIDLSVGSVSGLSAALLAVTFVNRGWPVALAILTSLAVGAVIGWFYAQMFNRFGVPSFVATLAGLLGFLGLQLYVLGAAGSINIPFDSWLVNFAQSSFVPEWLSYVLAVIAGAGYFASQFFLARARRKAGLSAKSVQSIAIIALAIVVGAALMSWFLNQSTGRGIGWMFVFFVVLVVVLNYALTRTKWGRSVFAVGGNAEAARRAGINVRLIYTSVFVLCSTLAALGGVLASARLAASNQATGAGDVNLNAIAAAVIGGTSLFGGRGSAFSAILGIVVIQSISSGLTLLNLGSSFRFIVTGAVLLLAVALDSVSRRSRGSHGKA